MADQQINSVGKKKSNKIS